MVTADNRMRRSERQPARLLERPRSWSECKRIGRLLADESLRIIASAPWQSSLVVKNFLERSAISCRVERYVAGGHSLAIKIPARRRSQHQRANQSDRPGWVASTLTIPGEALPNIGLYLKRKMQGEHKFLFGLTNDAFGYILTEVDSTALKDSLCLTGSLGEK